MQIGTLLDYSGGFTDTIAEVAEMERAGVDIIFVPELYSFDAVSQLGFIAARTSTMKIASGILQIYTRTPALTAMTAAGLDYVSGGRFVLGIGASGPQVVEGFHGVKYDAPIGRTREVVEICRAVWRRERLAYSGKHYQIPLPSDMGTGLGKSLKLINKPVREKIPVVIAALGEKNVALTAELAEGWQPTLFLPEQAERVWGDALAAGRAKRDESLGPLEIFANPTLAIGADAEKYLRSVKPHLALYIGGMGARGKNFYNDLAQKYGFEEEAEKVQDLYLAGKKEEAAAAVPDDLARAINLIGSESYIRDRIAAFSAAGVTTLNVNPLATSSAGRVQQLSLLRGLVDEVCSRKREGEASF
ncbi:LLM class F420-dependent oxidoreductase [Rhodococcoides kroppenstedtii]|uniref:LLM class F420-dependent oxidoreductase n=1 Tax=Rhodococcoides kroppenstedtii TaxID=293050 RepID=UPI0028E8D936|nr:LLM class F420-dependent oxidoreductase [Rhodococcus kroppenstedtii]